MFEIKYLRPILGSTRWDWIRNDEIKRRVGIENNFTVKVDRRVLRRFGGQKGWTIGAGQERREYFFSQHMLREENKYLGKNT